MNHETEAAPAPTPELPDEYAIAQAFRTHHLRTGGRPVPIELAMNHFEAFMLLAQLQLARRHPNNHGHPRRFIDQVAKIIGDRLIRDIPELEPVITAGWNGAS